MARIGRFWLVSAAFLDQAEALHDALDFLLVDAPSAALQFLGDLAVAVEGKFLQDRLDQKVSYPVVAVSIFFTLFNALGREADCFQVPAQGMGCVAELLNELFLYVYAKPRLSDTFFKNSFCTASFPTMRSSSSSFLAFSSSTFLVSNILGAPARNRSFHSLS